MTTTAVIGRPEAPSGPPKLTPALLREAQQQTLAAPRLRCSMSARALFKTMVDRRGDDDVVHRLQCDRGGRAAHDRVRHRGADAVGGGRFLAHGCYSWVAGSTISMSPVLTS